MKHYPGANEEADSHGLISTACNGALVSYRNITKNPKKVTCKRCARYVCTDWDRLTSKERNLLFNLTVAGGTSVTVETMYGRAIEALVTKGYAETMGAGVGKPVRATVTKLGAKVCAERTAGGQSQEDEDEAEHDRLKDLVRQLLDTHAYEATTTAQNTLIVQIRSIVGRTTK
jgi:hypothetical protein